MNSKCEGPGSDAGPFWLLCTVLLQAQQELLHLQVTAVFLAILRMVMAVFLLS